MTKIWNQVQWKDRVDPQRTRLTLIEGLTWSNLGLIKDFKKLKWYIINRNDINISENTF